MCVRVYLSFFFSQVLYAIFAALRRIQDNGMIKIKNNNSSNYLCSVIHT